MSHRQHSHRHWDHHGRPSNTSTSAPPWSDGAQSSEMLFSIDRKGDFQNLSYGSIDQHKIPKYRTTGYGRVVGLDRRYKIIGRSSTDRQINDESVDSSMKSRSFPQRLRHHDAIAETYVKKPELTAEDFIADQHSYVALDRKRMRISKPQMKDTQSSSHAVSLENVLSESGTGTDSDSAASSSNAIASPGQIDEQNAFETFKNNPDHKRHIELRNKTDRYPHDAEAWLDLIDHQERYFKVSAGNLGEHLNASQSRNVSDMKVALFEKAIQAVPSSQAREKLILGLMKEGSKVWDTNKQFKEWKLVLDGNCSIELWYEYLNFRQTNAITFSYDQCLRTYLDVLRAAIQLKDEDGDFSSTYTILRLTTFMREAGFTERAIAIWQALLEYNLLRPQPGGDDLQAFEAFWESECPRIGEQGAQGWYKGMEHDMPPRTDAPPAILSSNTLFLDWGSAEQQRSTDEVMPARTLDDTIEDDPFRVILFVDIKDFMFLVKSSLGQTFLQQAFLKFCGLPPLLDHTGRCREWWNDPFLCDFSSDLSTALLTDKDTLFPPPNSALNIWHSLGSIPKSFVEFATRSLGLLVETNKADDHLAEYLIALHLAQSSKSARKFAKRLLKDRSNSLSLYNAYALVEARDARTEAASNVWSTALSMASSLGSDTTDVQFTLWHSWIYELMQDGQDAYALALLIEAVPYKQVDTKLLQSNSKHSKYSAGQRLRAEAFFHEKISRILAEGIEAIVPVTALLAMLKYLLSNKIFGAGVAVYESTLTLLNNHSSSQIRELLHQSRARFAYYHTSSSTSGYQPAQFVSLLEHSRTAFPDNALFFKLYEQYLRHAGIVDRVRMSRKDDSQSTSAVPLLQAISGEISRPLYSGSTVHSVRRAFTQASSNEAQSHRSPALWLTWLRWEDKVASGESKEDLKHRKEVYLSALRSCPWSKSLYLLGFTIVGLRTALEDRELKKVYRSMTERGIRLRHDIIDMLE